MRAPITAAFGFVALVGLWGKLRLQARHGKGKPPRRWIRLSLEPEWPTLAFPSRSHSTGTSTGAPLSLIKTTRNFAGLVLFALPRFQIPAFAGMTRRAAAIRSEDAFPLGYRREARPRHLSGGVENTSGRGRRMRASSFDVTIYKGRANEGEGILEN
jgi:hypothetical protein